MKLLRVAGARPQFMQAAVLRQELDKRGYQEILVHTGQHYDDRMSRIFFDELAIPEPDINLAIGSSSHGVQTGGMMASLDKVVEEVRPDVIVVDGDTNSTLAGALVGAKLHVPVVHVEAGLRSFDRKMPEEINRIVTDHVSALLCAPTLTALKNLAHEGLKEKAFLTGDLMFDCFLHYRKQAKIAILDTLQLNSKEYVLVTIHRVENTDNEQRMNGILSAVLEVDQPAIFPVHPRSRKVVEKFFKGKAGADKVQLIDPIGYLEMVALEVHAKCIITDSGGVQREAFFAHCPSIVTRDTSEWKEQVESGWTILSGANKSAILAAYQHFSHSPPVSNIDIYGEGDAARKIVNSIEELLG